MLFPNNNNPEESPAAFNINFTSTGFELLTNNDGLNRSGGHYIYAAFGQYTNGTQLTFENDRDLKYLSAGDDVRQDNSPVTPTTSEITNVDFVSQDINTNGADTGTVECTTNQAELDNACLLYTSPSPRDATLSRMPSSA